MIIGVLNQKGGVGKTTISVNLAAVLSHAGNRLLLVDADPQASALDWQSAREGESLFPVIGMAKPIIHKDLPEIAVNYDHVIIDGPPRVNDLARSAMLAADLVVIPVQPSPYDVWAADEIVTLINEASVYNEKLKSVFTINRKITNTAIGRDVAEALRDYSIPVTQSAISQRVVFAESAASGLSVLEIDPESSASSEIKALTNELLAMNKGD